jgi:hypothetical protein
MMNKKKNIERIANPLAVRACDLLVRNCYVVEREAAKALTTTP